MGLEIDDNYVSNRTSPRSSNYGPRDERSKLLGRASLIIIDEESMIERRFFEMISAILKDIRCSRIQEGKEDTRPRFGGLKMVFAGDYMQQVSVVP